MTPLGPLGRVPVGSPPQRVIVAGDNLWNVAQSQYGSGAYFTDIARRNHISNPNLVQPGQQLVLPPVNPRHPERLWIPPLSGAGGRPRHG
jgi:LysM repeat protein